MKRFALVALLAAMFFGAASSASATELMVKGNLDVYGMWSANLNDYDRDEADADNFFAVQRMRTYFTFQAHENLKAVLGLEMDEVWGQGGGKIGTDSSSELELKHAYLDFNFPDSTLNVKAGLQAVALPAVDGIGNPVLDDDAAALLIGGPINEYFGLTAGYVRATDLQTNVDAGPGMGSDEYDAVFVVAPMNFEGFAVSPYLVYGQVGENVSGLSDDMHIWVAGANFLWNSLDPFSLAGDFIYGRGDSDDYDTAGFYAALAASYKMDFMTATMFGTFATGADNDDDDDNWLPTISEGWGITPYIGGARAFNAANDSFFTDSLAGANNLSAGQGMWTVGLALKDITFVEKLSHDFTAVYARGTSDDDTGMGFDKDDSALEFWLVNKYMIYENLAAISELGCLMPHLDDQEDDTSYFGTIGFQYKF